MFSKFKVYWESIGKPPLEVFDGYDWYECDACVNGIDYRIKGDPHWELRRKWIESDFTLPIEHWSGNDWCLSTPPLWVARTEYREATQSPMDEQIGGDHYKTCAIQPVEFIEANGLGFLEGCVVKRIARHNKPSGKGRQDIEKAIHELQLLLHHRY